MSERDEQSSLGKESSKQGSAELSAWERYLAARIALFQYEWEECRQKLIARLIGLALVILSLFGLIGIYFQVINGLGVALAVGLWQWVGLYASAPWFLLGSLSCYVCVGLIHALIAWVAWRFWVSKSTPAFEASISELKGDMQWLKDRMPSLPRFLRFKK